MELQRYASILIRESQKLLSLTGEHDSGAHNNQAITEQIATMRSRLDELSAQTGPGEKKKDTSPFIRSPRIKRIVLIEERNDPPAPNTFDTKVTYDSDDLPEWFTPLQPIVEDETFTSLEISLGNGRVRYQVSIAQKHLPSKRGGNK